MLMTKFHSLSITPDHFVLMLPSGLRFPALGDFFSIRKNFFPFLWIWVLKCCSEQLGYALVYLQV